MSWFKGATGAGVFTALFIGIFPFVAYERLFYGSVNGKYFYLLTFVSFLALWFSYRLATGKHTLSVRGRWLLMLSVLTVAVSYLAGVFGIFPGRSFFAELLRSTGLFYLTYVWLLAFILSEVLNVTDWRLVRRSIALSSGLFAFLTLLGKQGFGLSGEVGSINLELVGLTLGNETFAGVYLTLGLAVTLIELFRSITLRERAVFGGLLIIELSSPLLFNTVEFLQNPGLLFADPPSLIGTARASSVAVVMLLLYVLGAFVLKRWGRGGVKKYGYAAWASLWLLGIATLLGLLFTPGSPVQERYIQESTAARIIVWEAGFEAFKERPVLGWGPENFRFALDHHFDNRLYLDENIGEIWFDRAHNLFVDTLVNVGVLGFLLHLLVTLYAIVLVIRVGKEGSISEMEAHILGALIVAHVVQLQTGFDTVGTYGLLGVIAGYYLWLERNMHVTPLALTFTGRRVGGGALAAVVVVLSIFTIFAEYRQQKSLYNIFTTTNAAEQKLYVAGALTQQSDFEAFRLASASLVRGILTQLSKGEMSAGTVTAYQEQLALYEGFLRRYVADHPEDYRTRMNFVNILFLETILGENKLTEAKEIINASYELSPENPLTHVMAALAELYGGNIEAAQAKIAEGVALNPDIEYTREIQDRINRQAANFPNITVIPLENL